MKNIKVEISVKTIAYFLLIIAGVFILSKVTDILVLLMIAFVLMTALRPLVVRLTQITKSPTLAVLSVYALLISSLVVVGAAIVPPLIEQTARLVTQINLLDTSKYPLLEEFAAIQLDFDQVSSLLSQYGTSVGTLFSYVASTFSVVFSLFTILIMTLYLLFEREHLYRYAAFLFRTKDRDERSRSLFNAIEEALGGWVRGEFILMVVIGVMTYIGLVVLGIPYALPLAIFAGLLEALPNLGPTISAVPAVIVALTMVSPTMGLITAVLYILIQVIENNLIVPQVMKKAVGISPLTSIVLILMGVRFGSFIGALLVIPTYIIIRVILREFSQEVKALFEQKSTE